MTRVLLIRHAATDAVGKHLSGRAVGVHLNEEGKRQAERLAGQLAGLPITALYSSPLERALETAGPVARLLRLEPVPDDAFLELDFGEWTGRAFPELEGEPQFRLFNTWRSGTRIPGGELMLEAQLRMVSGLQKLRLRHPGQTIAAVSHSDMIKAALAYFAGIHLDLFHRLEISPASVSILELYEETARILLLNHTGAIPQ